MGKEDGGATAGASPTGPRRALAEKQFCQKGLQDDRGNRGAASGGVIMALTFSETEIQALFGHEAAEDEDPQRLRTYYFGSTWWTTSQSHSTRMAARCCFTVGADPGCVRI